MKKVNQNYVKGREELQQAVEYETSGNKQLLALCLFIVLIVVILVVILYSVSGNSGSSGGGGEASANQTKAEMSSMLSKSGESLLGA